ncbi:MAG: ribonuclease P protein component [Chitinophagaceae bacterium]|nr:ribonuclease P protein component [Chitinophagaceae bacterium]
MTTHQQYTLGKEERLKSRKQIERLFKEGQSFNSGILKVFHQLKEGSENIPLQFGVGVGTRHFKKAVDRNRIKRLVREACRLQKNELQSLLAAQNKQLNLFFIYTGKELPDYELVSEKTAAALNKLMNIYK